MPVERRGLGGRWENCGRLRGTSYLAGRGEQALFDARTINEDAMQLLRFLAKHCNKEGATYVLTARGRGAHIELYDVDRLADTSRRHWKWLLATLAARIARRLGAHLRSSEDVSDELRERHGALIDSALDLLSEVRDLGGASHDALRRSLHEAGALALLPGFVPSTLSKRRGTLTAVPGRVGRSGYSV